MERRYARGEKVAVTGECGHSLRVEDIMFAGAVGQYDKIDQPRNAVYWLRCTEQSCGRKYSLHACDGVLRSS